MICRCQDLPRSRDWLMSDRNRVGPELQSAGAGLHCRSFAVSSLISYLYPSIPLSWWCINRQERFCSKSCNARVKNEHYCFQNKKKTRNNTEDSLVVTYPTTNSPACGNMWLIDLEWQGWVRYRKGEKLGENYQSCATIALTSSAEQR